jgi:hypothetical protein
MPRAADCVYSLWISYARNVRNSRSAAHPGIAPQSRTRRPQLSQRQIALQVHARKAQSGLSRAAGPLY